MVDAKHCIPAFNIWPDPSAGPPLPPPVLGCLAMVRVTPSTFENGKRKKGFE